MSEEATLDEFAEEGTDVESSKQKEWMTRELSEVTQITMGSSPKSEYYNENGNGLPFFQSNDEFGYRSPTHDRWCSNPRKVAQPGDLLMTIRGTYVGQMNIADRESCIGRGLAGITPGKHLNGEFLLHYLNYIEPYVKSIAIGSTFDSISSAEINSLEVNVPPLQEQRKIATVLHNVDQAIQKTEEIIKQSQSVKKGLVQELLTEGSRDHSEYENYRLGPIDLQKPVGWELRTFDDFSHVVRDGPHITPDYVDDGVPFISSQNVNPFRDEFDYSQYQKYISDETYEEVNQNCRPEKGDLIISRRATIGPTQLIRHEKKFAFFVGVAIVKTDDSVHNPFLEQLMNWSVMEKLWHLKSPGSTMKTLNLGTIKDQKIPLPSLDEQKKITNILCGLDEEIIHNEQTKQSLQRIKQGLMQDLLSGKVRTTDTNIEVSENIMQHG